MTNEEKLQNFIDKEYGRERYNRFIRALSPIVESIGEESPFRVNIPDVEPDDLIHYKVSVENPLPAISVTKFQDIVDKRYEELKKEYGYGGKTAAFDELKQQLKDEGKNPEKYGLKFDPESFDAAFRKRKNKSYKKSKGK